MLLKSAVNESPNLVNLDQTGVHEEEPSEQDEKQQQTQPTYGMTPDLNLTRAIGGRHCAISALLMASWMI